MSGICRCQAYGYAQHMYTSLFFKEDPEKGKVGKTTDVKKHPSMTRFGSRGKNLFILGFIVVKAVDMRM